MPYHGVLFSLVQRQSSQARGVASGVPSTPLQHESTLRLADIVALDGASANPGT
jgi:hypothetical protein